MTLFLATWFGVPISTTHAITGAIVGVGAARRVSAALGHRRQHPYCLGPHDACRGNHKRCRIRMRDIRELAGYCG